jgi:hypothetical protein
MLIGPFGLVLFFLVLGLVQPLGPGLAHLTIYTLSKFEHWLVTTG